MEKKSIRAVLMTQITPPMANMLLSAAQSFYRDGSTGDPSVPNAKGRIAFMLYPVVQSYPDLEAEYRAVVSHPMDVCTFFANVSQTTLSTDVGKVTPNRRYTHVGDVLSDIVRIGRNCEIFNKSNDVLVKIGRVFVQEILERFVRQWLVKAGVVTSLTDLPVQDLREELEAHLGEVLYYKNHAPPPAPPAAAPALPAPLPAPPVTAQPPKIAPPKASPVTPLKPLKAELVDSFSELSDPSDAPATLQVAVAGAARPSPTKVVKPVPVARPAPVTPAPTKPTPAPVAKPVQEEVLTLAEKVEEIVRAIEKLKTDRARAELMDFIAMKVEKPLAPVMDITVNPELTDHIYQFLVARK